MSAAAEAPVLLTGATGYVGGRLLAALEARGLRVRCLSRRPDVLRTRVGPGTELQPIAVEDVIDYLVAAAEVPLASSRVVEIGGADVVSYHELMLEYARLRGLRRLIWLRLVTPLYAHVGRALLESIRNETTVNDPSALGLFGVRPRGVAEAISRALSAEDEAFARTRWCDALAEQAPPYGGVRFGRRLVDSRAVQVPVPPQAAFVPIARIGGDTGWYHAGRLLRLRGLLDLLAGGVGTRRGRPWPDRLHVGDTVDFWRVEAVEPARLLRLAAEMKVPGRAWLQFEVMPRGDGSTIRQTAIFDPAGPTGLLYWYALYPLHALVFRGMLRGIAAAAVRGAGETSGRSGHAGGARAW